MNHPHAGVSANRPKGPAEFAVKIDTLALTCCTRATKTEARKLFAFMRTREDDGTAAPRRYASRSTYYKGKRKGQMKDVFDINGQVFNQLWATVAPYVYTSTRRSVGRFTNEIEDIVSEIRSQLFYILRFFGPTPNNKPLSTYLKLITNNVLTVQARQRVIKTSYHTISLSTPVGQDDDDAVTLGDMLPGETPSFDILVTFNNTIDPLLQAALGNDFSHTARDLGYTRKGAREHLKQQLF